MNPPISLESDQYIWNSTVAAKRLGRGFIEKPVVILTQLLFKVELHCENHSEYNISFNQTETIK